MPTIEDTVEWVVNAATWDERVARLRQIPQRHGINDQTSIFAQVARLLYVPHLAPDYAYVDQAEFYELPHFQAAYEKAAAATSGFTEVSVTQLAVSIMAEPIMLLPLRVITGLTRGEFAASTKLVAAPLGMEPLSPNKVDSMERSGSRTTADQARVAAEAIDQILNGTLFGNPPTGLKSKQDKPDTVNGWASVQEYAAHRVPYDVFLHQRHYGGAFRQLLDATSERRGDLIEDEVETLFKAYGIPYIRTGSHNQADIAANFGVNVQPAPDFVVHDGTGALRAMLECKGANDGGTARDKAGRFVGLHAESVRLGGVPVVAVLGGLGWTRVNDTLGPVVRDCDGRVFTVADLPELLEVAPFSSLVVVKLLCAGRGEVFEPAEGVAQASGVHARAHLTTRGRGHLRLPSPLNTVRQPRSSPCTAQNVVLAVGAGRQRTARPPRGGRARRKVDAAHGRCAGRGGNWLGLRSHVHHPRPARSHEAAAGFGLRFRLPWPSPG
jgi:hypothetical protein